MLKAIVFDFDGVIADSEPLHYRAFLAVSRTIGHDFDYDYYLAHYIGFDDRDGFRAMIHDAGVKNPPPIDELVARKADAFEAEVNQGIEGYAGIADLIAQAHGRLPLAIASGATRRDIELILQKLGLGDRFDTIVTADDVTRSKPDPETYAQAVQRLAALHPQLALLPGEALAIEDTAAGIASAKAAGLMTLGLTTTSSAEQLFAAQRVIADLQNVSLSHLASWFGPLPTVAN